MLVLISSTINDACIFTFFTYQDLYTVFDWSMYSILRSKKKRFALIIIWIRVVCTIVQNDVTYHSYVQTTCSHVPIKKKRTADLIRALRLKRDLRLSILKHVQNRYALYVYYVLFRCLDYNVFTNQMCFLSF